MSVIYPYKNSEKSKKEQVIEMFDSIAPRYDSLNHILSFGIDKFWRWSLVRRLTRLSPKRILDVATGTGDLAIHLSRKNPQAHITGVDISSGMISVGIDKYKRKSISNIEMQIADSESLPFDDGKFDCVTVAFGVRNFENLKQGISEIYRVLDKGGSCFILEFSQPSRNHFFGFFYHLYFKYVLPLLGRLLSKDDSAYAYLPSSVKAFPQGKEFTKILEEVGFTATKHISQTFGVATIYFAKKI